MAQLVESACSAGDLDSTPGLGRSHGEGKDYLLQYSGLENSMDCILHEVSKSRAQLSDFHFHYIHMLFFHYGLLQDVEYSSLCYKVELVVYPSTLIIVSSANPKLPILPPLGNDKSILYVCKLIFKTEV